MWRRAIWQGQSLPDLFLFAGFSPYEEMGNKSHKLEVGRKKKMKQTHSEQKETVPWRVLKGEEF